MDLEQPLIGTKPSAAVRVEFEASAAAVATWERAHPRTLDDYLEFLDELQRVFGVFPVSDAVSNTDRFLL
jgi:hypothetical protein